MRLDCEVIRDAHGATYEPWTDGWAIGFKVTRDGKTEIVCINPSSQSDDGVSNVFIYMKTGVIRDGNPEDRHSVIYIDLFQSEIQIPPGGAP